MGIATELYKSGGNVCLFARRQEKLEKGIKSIESTLSSIVSAPGECCSFSGDVTKIEDFKKAKEFLKAKYPSKNVTILVNNAGIMPCTMMKKADFEKWNRTIDINIKGTTNGIATFLPDMLKQKTGEIICISSNGSKKAYQGLAVYCASKAAIDMLVLTLSEELNGSGVRAVSIQPGDVTSDLYENEQDDEEALGLVKPAEDGAWMKPEDIGKSVVYVCNQNSRASVKEILIEPVLTNK